MTDLSTTIAPKSDQLNADDLIGGPRTITIAKVSACDGEQPIAINFQGDNGKPYKPCKSMRRVLVSVWGKDGNAYAGRSLTLYRDDKVLFGGIEVGGIRISHMSDIDNDVTMALTATKKSRKPFTVRPLRVAPTQPALVDDREHSRVGKLIARINAAPSKSKLDELTLAENIVQYRAWLKDNRPELEKGIAKAVKHSYEKFLPPPDENDDFPGVVTPPYDPTVDDIVGRSSTRMAG